VPAGHKCARLHGHRFKVEIAVEGEVDPRAGWLYDHARITEIVQPVVKRLDHAHLNKIKGLENPTFEMLAAWLWRRLEKKLPGLCQIVIHETPSTRCVYEGR